MNTSINPAAQCYVATIWGKVVGFIAVIHFPHPRVRNMKKITRLVVLPDYQGIGVGKALLNFVGTKYKKLGNRVTITTSHPALNKSLKYPWKLTRQGRTSKNDGIDSLKKTVTMRRMTCSWEFGSSV